jgi:hypothetical protein
VVVQYLYVHRGGEAFHYPSSRDRSGSPERLALRYLECVLVQAASLRLRGADCELVLVTNLAEQARLGRAATRLLRAIDAAGVELVDAEYEHAPPTPAAHFAASRYVFDAIRAATAGGDPDRPMWFVDVDCVWLDFERAFAALPASPAIGCVEIPYLPDWRAGPNRRSAGRLAQRLGAPPGPPPPWVGGELLAGRGRDLLALLRVCEALEEELVARGVQLDTEEELLTLARALGRVQMENMDATMGRIWTGPRHGAANPEVPGAIAVWHLPSEKGLGFRRAAREVQRGQTAGLLADLEDPARAMRRFNIEGAGAGRRARDDLWLLKQRGADALRSRIRSSRGTRSGHPPARESARAESLG